MRPDDFGCALLDLDLPGLSGFIVLQELRSADSALAVVAVSEKLDVATTVRTMRAGATSVLECAAAPEELREVVAEAIRTSRRASIEAVRRRTARERLSRLTSRQREVLELAVAGLTNEAIAMTFGISRRSVERHRSAALAALGVETLQHVTALAVEAGGSASSFPVE